MFPRSFKREYPVAETAEGVWITDTEGVRYLDGSSGAVVSNLGHGLTSIVEAIAAQSRKLAFAHTSQFLSEPAIELCDRLLEIAPRGFSGGKVFLTCGGSESVETAIKLARSFFVEEGEPSRDIIISRLQSYHGATIGALSATGHPVRRSTFLPILGEPAFISANYRYRCRCESPGPCNSSQCDIDRANELETIILQKGPERVMAFIGEPIVGATLGAAVPGDEYWKRIREICTKYGVLLIADEVMTGLGRCGSTFGMSLWNAEPDMIVLGKGLAAGYQPLGGVIMKGKIAEAFEHGSGAFLHGYTYSGHPVAAAAGLASLEHLMETNLVHSVGLREKPFFERLNSLYEFPFVGDIRGRGFLAGIELVQNKETKEPFPASLATSKRLERISRNEGLLVYPGSGFLDGITGDQILVAPPLTITMDEIDELVNRLERSFRKLASELKETEAATRSQ